MGLSNLKSLKRRNTANQFILLTSGLYFKCMAYNHPFSYFVSEGFQIKALDAQAWNSHPAEISCLYPKILLKMKHQVMEMEIVTESSK